MAQCEYILENGSRCQANAVMDSTLCFSHDPNLTEAKMIAVKKGGENRRLYQSYGEAISLETPADIKKLMGDTINLILTGKMPSNQPANSIAYMAKTWLDAHEASEYEDRLEALEKKLEKLKI